MENKGDPVEVCRTCMTTTGSSSKRNKRTQKQLVPVFAKLNDAFIANIITECTGVQISENDGLPATICSDCFETVKLLVAFIKATRDCDIKLRMLWKVESLQDDCDDPMETTEADAPHFLDIKCEAPEQMEDETAEVAFASERGDVEPDNDTDTDWKASGDEMERSTKKRKLGLRSKPKPRVRKDGASVQKKRGRAPKKENQSEDSQMLNKEERELFTVINIAPNSHLCCGCLKIFESAEELDAHRETQHVWKNHKLHKPDPSRHECQGCLRKLYTPQGVKRHQERVQNLKTIWECKKCKKRFKFSGKRRDHAKLHAEGMPVALVVRINESTKRELGWKCCALKCGQSFDTEKDLVAHGQESHWADKLKADKESAIKPEQCQICFRRFAERKQVVSHQRGLYYKRDNFQCTQCGLKFSSSVQVKAHEVRAHGSKIFHCKICDKTFTTSTGLDRHVAIIHEKSRTRPPPKPPVQSEEGLELNEEEQKLFTVIEIKPNSNTCCGCLQVYESPEELELHRETTHVWKNKKPHGSMSSKHNCDGCLRQYGTPSGVKKHKERVRLLKFVWQCNRCKKRFKVAGKRREHAKLHAEGMPVAMVVRFKESTQQEFGWLCCAVKCGQSYTTEKELIAHAHTAHWPDKEEADRKAAEKPEQCQICFRRFNSIKQIVSHQRQLYYKREKFQCSLCGLKFISTPKLTAHEVRVHGIKKFQCHICEKTFISGNGLTKHIEIMHETEGKPHQCSVCGMQFKQKSTLNVHMDTHKDYAEFKCEYCPKAFKSKLRRMYHMRTHTGEKPHKCRICGHAFANHTNCRRHEMTHTGDKPHKCSYCEKSFVLRRMLLEHEAVHTGIKYNRKVRNKQSTKVSTEVVVDHEESIELDESYYNESSSDVTYQSPTTAQTAMANRPASISVVRPTAAHPGNVVYQTALQQPVATTASNEAIQSAAIAVYSILPSTSTGNYGYVLKY